MNDAEDVLGNKDTLQKDIAAFKKLSRTVFNPTCPPEHEWVMKPSSTRQNRLRSIAVANKHASIRGMPAITDKENRQIVKRLMAMRGIRNPKQKKAWGDGNLFVKPAVISLRGGAKWIGNDDNDEKMANWVTRGLDGEEAWNNLNVIKLRYMACPGCNKRIEVNNLKLVRGAQFSSLTCPSCKQFTNSRFWTCDCHHLWHTCSLHVKVPHLANEPTQVGLLDSRRVQLSRGGLERKTKWIEKGVHQPLPRFRRIEENVMIDGRGSRDYYRVSLPPGTKLALRFPHHVKKCEDRSLADSA